MLTRIILTIILSINIISCSKNNKPIVEETIKDPFEIYNEAMEAFNINDFFYASEKFNEAELAFNKVEFAAKSAIMSSYSLYAINLYKEAEENLERYLKNYPVDKNVIYAHYLMAVIHFEQIGAEEYDLEPLLRSRDKIDFFIKKYPNTEYTIDLKFKKGLLENQFAAKEMYNAKYYISVQKWVPAINRLKIIVKNYDQTIFIEEALHRLVEINYHLGLEEEAKKYASILGYNYNSSEWFKKSYKVLNKDYKIITKKINKREKEKKGLFKKIIKMIK